MVDDCFWVCENHRRIRACLLFTDLRGEEVTDDALRLMLAFDGGGHDPGHRGAYTISDGSEDQKVTGGRRSH